MSESKATLFELPVPTDYPAKCDIEPLRKKAFKWKDEAEADERFIRQAIRNWLKEGNNNPNFTQMLRTAIWHVNDKGKTIKYLHFNERTQRIRIDNDFWAWAEMATEQILLAIEKIEQ